MGTLILLLYIGAHQGPLITPQVQKPSVVEPTPPTVNICTILADRAPDGSVQLVCGPEYLNGQRCESGWQENDVSEWYCEATGKWSE